MEYDNEYVVAEEEVAEIRDWLDMTGTEASVDELGPKSPYYIPFQRSFMVTLPEQNANLMYRIRFCEEICPEDDQIEHKRLLDEYHERKKQQDEAREKAYREREERIARTNALNSRCKT